MCDEESQPLSENVPAFCLMIFASDSKFTAKEVEKRWSCIVKELNSVDIHVLSIGTASDPRYNSVMRTTLALGDQHKVPESELRFPRWFTARVIENLSDGSQIPVQDPIHLCLRLRNHYINKSLRIGNYNISASYKYVLTLVTKYPKQHKLTKGVVMPTDRQGIDNVLKICTEDVVELLENHVKNCEGTVFYIKLINKCMRSYLDNTLHVLDRIHNIWFVVFSLRIWRKHIVQKKSMSLDRNFLTAYGNAGVEINEHALIMIIVYLKENKLDGYFYPEYLGSQQCESLFRQLRSMTSTFSTKTNFSTLA